MFGSKKRADREDRVKLAACRELVTELAEYKASVESGCTEQEESAKRMSDDMELLKENVQTVLDYAENDAKMAAGLSGDLQNYRMQIDSEREQYANVVKQVQQHAQSCMELVDQNKHFTTPSKTLSDLPDELRGHNSRCREQLEAMQGYGRQMGVLALNAAIEAGRMGEAGRPFVLASEEVRSFSQKYVEAANQLLEEVKESESRIAGMEEVIHHLVGLLKENNVSTTKLMRSAQELQLSAEQTVIYGDCKKLDAIREDLIDIYNNQEEVVKAEERSRMHLEDMREEIDNQKQNRQELEAFLVPLMERAQEL